MHWTAGGKVGIDLDKIYNLAYFAIIGYSCKVGIDLKNIYDLACFAITRYNLNGWELSHFFIDFSNIN